MPPASLTAFTSFSATGPRALFGDRGERRRKIALDQHVTFA